MTGMILTLVYFFKNGYTGMIFPKGAPMDGDSQGKIWEIGTS